MRVEIISVVNELEKYVSKIEQGNKDYEKLWEETVIAPFWKDLCCYSPMDLSERKPAVIKNVDTLKKQIKLLKQIDIAALKAEFNRVVKILPNFDDDPITVALFPLDDNNLAVKEKQNGVVGTSLFGNLIIQVNPLAEDYERWIPYVFAHEYHHTVWGNYWFMINGRELQNKFIDSLVIDGEADSFALSLYGDLKPQWLFNLHETEIKELWDKHYKNIVMEQNVDYPKYMFGDEETGIPWCAGYAVGYRIIQKYLKKNNVSVINILKTKPEDILK